MAAKKRKVHQKEKRNLLKNPKTPKPQNPKTPKPQFVESYNIFKTGRMEQEHKVTLIWDILKVGS